MTKVKNKTSTESGKHPYQRKDMIHFFWRQNPGLYSSAAIEYYEKSASDFVNEKNTQWEKKPMAYRTEFTYVHNFTKISIGKKDHLEITKIDKSGKTTVTKIDYKDLTYNP